MSSTRALALLLALLVLVADQATKAWAVARVRRLAPAHQFGPPRVPLAGDVVRLVVVHNRGVVLGLGASASGALAARSLVASGAVATALVLVALALAPARGLGLLLGLGLVTGGAVGNVADRLRLGFVVDFLDVGIGMRRLPAFNVADAAILLGVAVVASRLGARGAERTDRVPADGRRG